jgi:hypothetical protein
MNDAARQAELYGRIWKEDPNYGTAIKDVVDTVLNRILPHFERVVADDRAHVVDFGAGDGRFLTLLLRGRRIGSGTGVDLHRPAVLGPCLHWEQVPMWESRARGHFAISTDALEHLPPDRVQESLDRIAAAAPHGFLRISLTEDRYGTERGLHLHESVFSSTSWRAKLALAGIMHSSYRVYLNAAGDEQALEVWY